MSQEVSIPLAANALNPFQALARLPKLAWSTLRWNGLRGHWLPAHLAGHRAFDRRFIDPGKPIDVMVCIVDHFEPARKYGVRAAIESVASWCARYRELADRHRDADGRPPQHTWFYRYDYPNFECVRVLSDYTFQGFGEVEFHLHHGNDTHRSFSDKLRVGMKWFNRAGAMISAEPLPKKRFGYIAGNWSLDNGGGDDATSGCNTEIIALRDAGCYADFTFPAFGSHAQPRKSNAIYYATDDPQPKSYDIGVNVSTRRKASGDLMIFQGPLCLDWDRGKIESAAVEAFAPASPRRLDPWLKANVHVEGRPEWVFVKLHTHGMQSREEFLSTKLDATFAAMSARWNQAPFRLHYVNSREAYNIAKAAEAGHEGNPNDYRDYLVAPPANTKIRASSPWKLIAYGPQRVCLETLERNAVTFEFAERSLKSIHGRMRRLEILYRNGEVMDILVDGEGSFTIEAPSQFPSLSGGKRWTAAELSRAVREQASARAGVLQAA